MDIGLVDINKSYKSTDIPVDVIRSFSYTFKSPNIYLLKGQSGRGKTTLLSMIGLLDEPSSGAIYFNNERVDNATLRSKSLLRKNKISFVFQEPSLLNDLTVCENILLSLEETDDASKRAEKVDGLLETLKLSHRKNHYAKYLSGGEKQRAALARAIIKTHEVLILDEPTSNLDQENTDIIINMIEDIRQSTLVVIACHANTFDGICDKMIEL